MRIIKVNGSNSIINLDYADEFWIEKKEENYQGGINMCGVPLPPEHKETFTLYAHIHGRANCSGHRIGVFGTEAEAEEFLRYCCGENDVNGEGRHCGLIMSHEEFHKMFTSNDSDKSDKLTYDEILNDNRLLLKLLDDATKWRKCSEKLPDVDEYVICYGDDGWNGGGFAMLKISSKKGVFGERLWTDGNDTFPIDSVTHWRPMPEAPKEDE